MQRMSADQFVTKRIVFFAFIRLIREDSLLRQFRFVLRDPSVHHEMMRPPVISVRPRRRNSAFSFGNSRLMIWSSKSV
jgi:hypothetical protein